MPDDLSLVPGALGGRSELIPESGPLASMTVCTCAPTDSLTSEIRLLETGSS